MMLTQSCGVDELALSAHLKQTVFKEDRLYGASRLSTPAMGIAQTLTSSGWVGDRAAGVDGGRSTVAVDGSMQLTKLWLACCGSVEVSNCRTIKPKPSPTKMARPGLQLNFQARP
eukprot:364892-Chlamydomonas_euryale.AAC.3